MKGVGTTHIYVPSQIIPTHNARICSDIYPKIPFNSNWSLTYSTLFVYLHAPKSPFMS